MAEKTGIAWCDSTFNPVIGCTKVGPGCDNCYAAEQDSRKRWDGGRTHWGAGVPRYRTSLHNWNQPIRWNNMAAAGGFIWRVFCGSLCDVFDNEWPAEARQDLWDLIDHTPRLSWLLVTKRIGNVVRMVPWRWANRFPDHVRLLITVCNQEEADRDIPKLLALPCKNGVSYEPALSAIDWRAAFTGYCPEHDFASGFCVDRSHPGVRHVEWLIVGGESGAKARPFDLSWARSTVAQCKAAGVPVFVKQLGRYPVPESDDFLGHRAKGHSFYRGWPSRYCDEDERVSVDLKDRAGADPSEWPSDLNVRQWPE